MRDTLPPFEIKNAIWDYLIAKDEMVMECPNCQTSFYLQMHTQLIGSNSRGMNVFVYYQMCPECKEPVVGVRELKDLLALSIDVQDLTLLTKPK